LLESGAVAARGARGVDKPEGIGRQAPKATTTMTTGKSGAKAPDRNRGPARPGPPPCRTPQELNARAATVPDASRTQRPGRHRAGRLKNSTPRPPPCRTPQEPQPPPIPPLPNKQPTHPKSPPALPHTQKNP